MALRGVVVVVVVDTRCTDVSSVCHEPLGETPAIEHMDELAPTLHGRVGAAAAAIVGDERAAVVEHGARRRADVFI